MAARSMKGTKAQPWPEATRKKIQTSMLINRLVDHVLGKVELSSTQVTAALGLIRKTLPDLAAVELSGDVTHTYVAQMPGSVDNADEWQRQHAPTIN